MRYAIVTFGCRVNQADSSAIEAKLRAAGGIADVPERADLVVVNTCTVTAGADQGARQAIRRLARMNPSARIVATGCYATRAAAELAALPGIAVVVPNAEKDRLGEDLAGDLTPTTAVRFADGEGPCGLSLEPGVAGRTALTLRVQTGCDEVCSYCIIPSTRGSSRSVPVAAVVRDGARAASAGFKEIVLTGVHLGSYGRDLMPPASLTDLLRALAALDADVHFRISSIEPMDCTPELIDLVAGAGRFAPHFHLPLQHASDRVLTAMRRPYTLDDYRRTVDRIRRLMPDASIGSDIIVGFPGENDADFASTLRYLAQSPLTYLHVFPYSDRPGTCASRLAGKVPGAVVRERAGAIRDAGTELARRFRQSQIGSVRPAVTLEDGTLALTDNYLKVGLPAGRARNERVRVRLSGAGDRLWGEVVS